MTDDRMHEQTDGLAGRYNPPGETPREEMWAVISAGMAELDARRKTEVVDLTAVRASRIRWRAGAAWTAAAAALVVVGVGIGRMTAPVDAPVAQAPASAARTDGLRLAAAEHFGRTESLLTMVRTDARQGRLDAETSGWARSLLTETRLLLDAEDGSDPTLTTLLEDLELVLVQIVGLGEVGRGDEGWMRTELGLALGGMENQELLERLQARGPARIQQGI